MSIFKKYEGQLHKAKTREERARIWNSYQREARQADQRINQIKERQIDEEANSVGFWGGMKREIIEGARLPAKRSSVYRETKQERRERRESRRGPQPLGFFSAVGGQGGGGDSSLPWWERRR